MERLENPFVATAAAQPSVNNQLFWARIRASSTQLVEIDNPISHNRTSGRVKFCESCQLAELHSTDLENAPESQTLPERNSGKLRFFHQLCLHFFSFNEVKSLVFQILVLW